MPGAPCHARFAPPTDAAFATIPVRSLARRHCARRDADSRLGLLFYPPVLMMPLIAAGRGWFSGLYNERLFAGLLVAGFAAPAIGGFIDRYGGHVVMTLARFLARWASCCCQWLRTRRLISRSGSFSGLRSRRAFTIRLSRRSGAFSAACRARPITALTFAGGFASTVRLARDAVFPRHGPRLAGTYLFSAGLLCGAAPLHVFFCRAAAARPKAQSIPMSRPSVAPLPSQGLAVYSGC